MSGALVVEFGHTGSASVGAEYFSAYTPTFYFGQGFGGSLQYSMPYLKSNVVDQGLPEFFSHLIPIVEFQFQMPVANYRGSGIGTTGTVSPGVIWVGRYFQVGLEAIIPVNRASGTGVGVIAQMHFYLDDLFPDSIGKPLFGSHVTSAKSPLGN